MNKENESIIQALESRLQNAMLNSNVDELNELLADDVIFTNHVGHLMTKWDDLNMHKFGILKIKKIELNRVQFENHSFEDIPEKLTDKGLQAFCHSDENSRSQSGRGLINFFARDFDNDNYLTLNSLNPHE